jgi:hypothetical protein
MESSMHIPSQSTRGQTNFMSKYGEDDNDNNLESMMGGLNINEGRKGFGGYQTQQNQPYMVPLI